MKHARRRLRRKVLNASRLGSQTSRNQQDADSRVFVPNPVQKSGTQRAVDLGDAGEWSHDLRYCDKSTSLAYRIAMNDFIYDLPH
jgi:hypothetical protein